MANTGFRGIDVRQTGNQLVFRASLKDAQGAKVVAGIAVLRLFEYQSDGTLKSYDFNDNTFKTTALTTATLAMAHQTGNNSTYNTGVWTAILATINGFTVGAVYLMQVVHTGASPNESEREFQYGSDEGDNVTQTGDSYGRLGAPAGVSVSADVAAIQAKTVNLPAAPASTTNITAGTITTVTNLTNAPTAGDFTATMKTSLNAATPAVTVSDKTGFKLASDGLNLVTAWTVAITGNITGNLSGSVASVAGQTLANLDAAVSSRLATSGYTAPDNTGIAAIKAKTDNLPASPAAVGSAMTLTSGERTAIASEIFGTAVEGAYTFLGANRIMLSALAGKVFGATTATIVFRDANDTKDRITATVDGQGNRTAITLDAA